jgi:hypothetical protein
VVNKPVWADIGATCAGSTNKNFRGFLNVCSTNILVPTGLQHQYIGAVQGEPNCLQHHAYSFKRCLFNLLEYAEEEIELFQDGGQIKIKLNVNHHNGR